MRGQPKAKCIAPPSATTDVALGSAYTCGIAATTSRHECWGGRWSRCSSLWLVTAPSVIASPALRSSYCDRHIARGSRNTAVFFFFFFFAGIAARTVVDAPSAAYLVRCSLTAAAQSPVVVRRKQHRETDAGARGRSSAPAYGWFQRYARCHRLWEAAARLSSSC
eukprot:COSAG02_NODE_31629_length_530_cov_0.941995_1_plen_164_part_10